MKNKIDIESDTMIVKINQQNIQESLLTSNTLTNVIIQDKQSQLLTGSCVQMVQKLILTYGMPYQIVC